MVKDPPGELVTLSASSRNECRDDVGGVPVEGLAGAVVAHRGAGSAWPEKESSPGLNTAQPWVATTAQNWWPPPRGSHDRYRAETRGH
ncbi:MAG: hypothetical protein ACKV2O_24790 [Acidimicrobiales bacterium]